MNVAQASHLNAFLPVDPAGTPPPPGGSVEIAPGVRWLRMSLPVELNHINLWALDDGAGWTIIDSGIDHPDARSAWERLLRDDLGGRPVTRVIATHLHPDHAGLAGWLVERFDCRLWMARSEYLMAKAYAASTGEEPAFRDLFFRAGWQPHEIDALATRRRTVAGFYSPLPGSYRRLRDGDSLQIGGRRWSIIAGGGHSPEHLCLHCPELGLFISGDKVLPTISSNISVDPTEPDGDPLSEWFVTLARIRAAVPADVLVLPSHGGCFTGLHRRIDTLVAEQRLALIRLRAELAVPKRADEVFGTLFSRPIPRNNMPLMGLATGESLAMLNHLIATGDVVRSEGADGAWRYHSEGTASP
ncbi:MAG: MBL fold metallo-hydrolase [Proteobacteria bacterium]|nr:MBL fold metallo-hydrolase [Pseudomonadota bacterium]